MNSSHQQPDSVNALPKFQQYEDTDTFVFDFPDSSDYTIGIIVDPCKVRAAQHACTASQYQQLIAAV